MTILPEMFTASTLPESEGPNLVNEAYERRRRSYELESEFDQSQYSHLFEDCFGHEEQQQFILRFEKVQKELDASFCDTSECSHHS